MRIQRTWKEWLLVAVGFTVTASFLAAWMGGGISPLSLLASFIYTVCIGTLCTLAGYQIWPGVEDMGPGVRWTARILSMALAVAAGTLVAVIILSAAGILNPRNFWVTYGHSLQFAAFISVTVGGTLLMYEYWRSKYEHSELERERALKLATEARLASLESRIHPHFLFNTLNSISSLIHSDANKADEQLQRLCALLRFSLDAAETPLVPLDREMKIVRDYLDIEKTRFGDRLRYSLDVGPDMADCHVPPLSVQTLVENAVKHVIAPNPKGGEVRIRTACRNGRFIVSVEDSGPGILPDSLRPGHGLDNLRSRLQVLYGNRASLHFEGSSVKMELPE